MSTMTLQHFYRGKLIEGQAARSDFIVTACSGGLTFDEAETLFRFVYPGSHNGVRIKDLTTGFALGHDGQSRYILSCVRLSSIHDRGYRFPVYHNIVIPQQILHDNPDTLQMLIQTEESNPAWPDFAQRDASLDPLEFSAPVASDKQADERTLNTLRAISANRIADLLSVILNGNSIAIRDAPPQIDVRLQFVHALRLLLPLEYRHTMTFSTTVLDSRRCNLKIKFMLNDTAKNRDDEVIWSWKSSSLKSPLRMTYHRYAQWIQSQWERDTYSLLRTVYYLHEPSQMIRQTYPEAAVRDWLDILGGHLLLLYEKRDDIDLLRQNLRHNPLLTYEAQRHYGLRLADKITAGAPLENADVLLEKEIIGRWSENFFELFINNRKTARQLLYHWFKYNLIEDKYYAYQIASLYLHLDAVVWLSEDVHLLVDFLNLLLSAEYYRAVVRLLNQMYFLHQDDPNYTQTVADLLARRLSDNKAITLLNLIYESDLHERFQEHLYFVFLRQTDWRLQPAIRGIAGLWTRRKIELETSVGMHLLQNAEPEIKTILLTRILQDGVQSQDPYENIRHLTTIIAAYQHTGQSNMGNIQVFSYNLQITQDVLNQLYTLFEDPEKTRTDDDYALLRETFRGQIQTLPQKARDDFREHCLSIAQMMTKRGRFFGGKSTENPLTASEHPKNIADALRWLAGIIDDIYNVQ